MHINGAANAKQMLGHSAMRAVIDKIILGPRITDKVRKPSSQISSTFGLSDRACPVH